MKCKYHEHAEAQIRCVDCGSPICKACTVNNHGQLICTSCAEKQMSYTETAASQKDWEEKRQPTYKTEVDYKNERKYNKQYSGFWAGLFSLFPGAGHMYLGLMNRGLQLMGTFILFLAIPNILYSTEFLGVFAAVVWFYSFFDAYHIRKSMRYGDVVEDELVYNLDVKNLNLYHIGIGLVVVGGIIMLNEGLQQLAYSVDMFSGVFRFLRRIIFPGLLIVSGVVLLRRTQKA